MKTKCAYKKIISNKKGFTMVEAIAVIAIMAIISVLIGSLLSSSSSFYVKEKNIVSAKEVSKVIEKEIKRLIVYKEYVYLQNYSIDINDYVLTDLPNQGVVTVGGKEYYPNNMPNPEVEMLYSTGIVMYNSMYYEADCMAESYFGANSSEIDAFYSDMQVDLSFKAVGGGNGKFQYLCIMAKVKSKNGKMLYNSNGTIVELKNLTKTGNGTNANEIKNFLVNEVIEGTDTYNYKNLINGINEYNCLLFA